MSTETANWLNNNVLVGYKTERGTAWHYRASEQGDEPNHYDGAIPIEDVRRRLFNFTAASAPVFMRVPCSIEDATGMDDDGNPFKMVQLEDRQAIYHSRTEKCFNIFKDGYQSHQFDQLLDIAQNMIDDDINIGSAGLLKEGAIAWVSIETPESIEVLEGFSVRSSILLTTSHNGTLATTIKPVDTFVVCDNTHIQALGEDSAQFKARHSKNSSIKISSVNEALGFVHAMSDGIAEEVRRLSEWKVTDDQFKKIVEHLAPIPDVNESSATAVTKAENRKNAIIGLYKDDARVSPWKGSALGVLQAFNTYNHHNLADKAKQAERNMINVLNGKTEQADNKVLTALRQFAHA
jgi:phage/plasmid-like protein (TIGR03299 family)